MAELSSLKEQLIWYDMRGVGEGGRGRRRGEAAEEKEEGREKGVCDGIGGQSKRQAEELSTIRQGKRGRAREGKGESCGKQGTCVRGANHWQAQRPECARQAMRCECEVSMRLHAYCRDKYPTSQQTKF